MSGSNCCRRSTSSPNMRRPESRLGVRGEHLERLAAHAEAAAREHVSLRVYWIETSLRSSASRSIILAALEDLHVHLIGLRRAQAVDARHRGHHDHVTAGEHRRRGGVAQAVDLLVDRRVLLDVQVLLGTYASGW